jgi:hypothetical protein
MSKGGSYFFFNVSSGEFFGRLMAGRSVFFGRLMAGRSVFFGWLMAGRSVFFGWLMMRGSPTDPN